MLSFLFPNLSDGAIYEPSNPKETKTIVNLLDIKSGDMAADLGAGDGRIVIAMAKKGAQAYGFEKQEWLVNESRNNIIKADLTGKASIIHKNFWDQNFSMFNKISIFQYHTVMERLEKKLLQELPHGAYVVSHHWEFPTWQPLKNIDDIYLYIK